METEKIIAKINKLVNKVDSFCMKAFIAMAALDVVVYHILGKTWFVDAGPAYGLMTVLLGCEFTAWWFASSIKKILANV